MKFDDIWKKANEEAELKYDPRGTISLVVFLKEALEKRIEPLLEKRQPEIPEFVANYIEAAKEDFWTLLSAMDDPNLSSRVGDWLKGGNFNNQEIFAQAWLNSYTVAKEKKYLLKHKSLVIYGDEDEETDADELYLNAEGNFTIYPYDAKIFTQSEIDGMETGSYEQIEVEE